MTWILDHPERAGDDQQTRLIDSLCSLGGDTTVSRERPLQGSHLGTVTDRKWREQRLTAVTGGDVTRYSFRGPGLSAPDRARTTRQCLQCGFGRQQVVSEQSLSFTQHFNPIPLVADTASQSQVHLRLLATHSVAFF
jgi:hypothetical protein